MKFTWEFDETGIFKIPALFWVLAFVDSQCLSATKKKVMPKPQQRRNSLLIYSKPSKWSYKHTEWVKSIYGLVSVAYCLILNWIKFNDAFISWECEWGGMRMSWEWEWAEMGMSCLFHENGNRVEWEWVGNENELECKWAGMGMNWEWKLDFNIFLSKINGNENEKVLECYWCIYLTK